MEQHIKGFFGSIYFGSAVGEVAHRTENVTVVRQHDNGFVRGPEVIKPADPSKPARFAGREWSHESLLGYRWSVENYLWDPATQAWSGGPSIPKPKPEWVGRAGCVLQADEGSG